LRPAPISRLRLNVHRNHGSHFEKAKTAFEEGGGRDELVEDPVPMDNRDQNSIEKEKIEEHVDKV
jgi:hypothetical protein